MTRVLTIAKSARRRRRVRALLRTFGAGMVFASIVEVITVFVDRGFALGLAWPALAAPAVVTLVIVMIPAFFRRDSLEAAAVEIDQNLQLADRLATGVAFAGLENAGPFETLAQRDAEEAAEHARVRDGVPVGLTRVHRWWPALAAGAVALAIWLPMWPASDAPQVMTAAQRAEREEASERINEAIEESALSLEEQPELFDDETRRDLEALEQIERELSLGEMDPEEAEAKAAEALSKAADRLEEEATREQQVMDATTERFAGAGDDPLGEALSEGEYEQAADELAAINESLENASDAERKAIAQRLREMAESIDTSAAPEPPTAAERLESEGLDPASAGEIGENSDPDAVREALESQGADPIESQRIADQLKQDAQQREAQKQSQQNAQKMKEALEQSAGQCENPSGEPGGANPGSQTGQGSSGAQGSQPAGSLGLEEAEQIARQMGQQAGDAEVQSQAAEAMREKAEKLASGSTPPSSTPQQGIGAGSARVERTPPPPNDALLTDAVDVRRGSDSTRVRAEVEAEGPAIARRGASPEQAQRTLQEAAPSAERALESQGVPARYRDLVRRYFRQNNHATSPAPAAAPADDDG